MGKKQTAQEKEEKRKQGFKQKKVILHIEHYVKKSGAIGLKKYYKTEEQNV